MLADDFTSLATLVTNADSDVPDGELPVIAYMTSAAGTAAEGTLYTLFAIPNAVFDEAAEAAGLSLDAFLSSFTPDSARATVLNHMIEGSVYSTILGEGGQYVTLAGNEIVSGTDPVSGDIVINQSISLVPGNTDIVQSNGIIHMIGGIIQ